MVNDNNQQPNNLTDSSKTPSSDEIPSVQTISASQSVVYEPAPVSKLHNYVVSGIGVLILLVIFLPASRVSQALAYPIIILGAVAGIKFFIDSIRACKRESNVFIKTFVFFGGLGIGGVIFIVFFIAGAIVGFSKDPNPQSTG